MDPNLYYTLLAAAGIVVSGGFTYWAGCRLLRLGQRGSGDEASAGPHQSGRTAAP